MAEILKMVAQRLGLGLLTLFVVSLIIFWGVQLLPGDVCQEMLGQAATDETVAACRRDLNGLPCERFTSAFASCRASLGPNWFPTVR